MTKVQIQAGHAVLSGNLTIPENAVGLALFAHGSGSSRHSPRNQFVARTLNDAGLATLLFDLLTQDEEAIDMRTREHRFNIGLLAERLVHATRWAKQSGNCFRRDASVRGARRSKKSQTSQAIGSSITSGLPASIK